MNTRTVAPVAYDGTDYPVGTQVVIASTGQAGTVVAVSGRGVYMVDTAGGNISAHHSDLVTRTARIANAEARIAQALATAVVAGRYQASNGANKRAQGDRMEVEARRDLAAALRDLVAAYELAN